MGGGGGQGGVNLRKFSNNVKNRWKYLQQGKQEMFLNRQQFI